MIIKIYNEALEQGYCSRVDFDKIDSFACDGEELRINFIGGDRVLTLLVSNHKQVITKFKAWYYSNCEGFDLNEQ